MKWKPLFSRALAANSERLHFAAHSHHLWPDAAYEGHMAACDDAMALADHKWEKIMGPVWAEAQSYIASELKLPDPKTIAFAPNTHDFLVRILSAIPTHPVRVLTTDGEFHSFRRQMDPGQKIMKSLSRLYPRMLSLKKRWPVIMISFSQAKSCLTPAQF